MLRLPIRPARLIAALGAAVLLAGACGDGEDRPGQVSSESETGSGSASGSASASGTGSASGSVSASGAGGEASAGGDGYAPVSSVDAHAAIGDDVAAIKEHLSAAKEGQAVDWAAVRATWENGGASARGDGSKRTLKELVDAPDVVMSVESAIAGGPSDAVRAQQVEKGITVLLARKVVDELKAAGEKAAAGDIAPADGAPHNVDEAWAFFTAKGHGPASTAEKRAADFDRDGKVLEPIIVALGAAQNAALDGDAGALSAAADEVRAGLDYVFYLATHKYLAAEDAVGRAEGAAFYLGIVERVRAADAEADRAIAAAFQSGDAEAGRAALHRPAVLTALGVDSSERVDG
jgi:hypothetical protein